MIYMHNKKMLIQIIQQILLKKIKIIAYLFSKNYSNKIKFELMWRKGGATRNFTNLFLKYRNDKAVRVDHFQPVNRDLFPNQSDQHNKLLTPGAVVMDMEPISSTVPEWITLYEKCSENISHLKAKEAELTKMQQQRLKPKFTQEDGKLDHRISECMRELYRILHECETTIKRLDEHIRIAEPVDARLCLNIQQTIAVQVQDITKNVRRSEKEYYIKRKEMEGDDVPLAHLQKGEQSHEEFLNDAERMEFNELEQETISRDVEIQNLVQSINDLAVIFKELSVLVVDQGNILDRIDYNIEQAVQHTKKANIQLHKSEGYQKGRIKTCIICLVVGIVIMVILLIIKHTQAREQFIS